MPGFLSFDLDKTLEVSTVITDVPTYKVINTLAPVFDHDTKVVIGKIVGQKEIIKDIINNDIAAKYTYYVSFSPETNVKGVCSFIFVYTADQLSPNGETVLIDESIGPINSAVSSGVFLGQNGSTRKVKDSSNIEHFHVTYPYGYSNLISNTQAPTKLNKKEYIVIDSVDTPSWVIGSDPTEIVCVEDGKWNLLSQYQLISLKAGLSTLNGWYNVNGVDVPDSDAEQCSNGIDDNSVLAIGLSGYFNKGDKVKFGILSSNANPTNTELGLVVKAIQSPSGLNTPAVIITASRVF